MNSCRPKRIGIFILFVFISMLGMPDLCPAQLYNIKSIEEGSRSSFAIRNDGKLLSWGGNNLGQLGMTIPPDKTNFPGLVYDIRDVIAIDNAQHHVISLKADGTVWGWGDNSFGQLSTGDIGGNCGPTSYARCTPIQLKDPNDPSGFITNVEAVATSGGVLIGGSSFFIKEDGSVWGVGSNADGQLGIGTVGGPCGNYSNPGSSYCYPVRVKISFSEYLTEVVSMTAGGSSVIVQKADGTVWSWGRNNLGQLGDGTQVRKLSPVQVALTGVAAIKTSSAASMALLKDGTVWTWGSNGNYTLGNSTSTSTLNLHPKQVELKVLAGQPIQYLTNIIAVDLSDYRAVALRADGTVWSWGSGYNGDGSSGSQGKAVQVKTSDTEYLENVISIKAGGQYNSLALKSDSSVWAWGDNYFGQSGVGNYNPNYYAVPVKMPNILLSVVPPERVSPGQRFTVPVIYQNIFTEILGEVVIAVDIPKNFQYVSSSAGGILWKDGSRYQVFWKLGNLDSLQRGELTITLQVPWGLGEGITSITGEIGARNLSSNINIDEYLTYNPRQIVSVKTLTPTEIDAELSSDQKVKDLYDYTLNLGYEFYGFAQKVQVEEGISVTHVLSLTMVDHIEKNLVSLYRVNNQVFIEKYVGNAYTRFDQNGGYTVDVNEGSINAWGTWAESHSLKFFHCLFNCYAPKVATWYVKKLLGIPSGINLSADCVKCFISLDRNACLKCSAKLEAGSVPGADFITPVIDAGSCLVDCLRDPDKHVCEKDIVRCEDTFLGYLFGLDTVVITKCDLLLHAYYPYDQRIFCGYGQKCVDGECLNLRDIENNGTFTTSSNAKIRNVNVMARRSMMTRIAGDPNQKSVDYPGQVIPGQRLTYTIEYENFGRGTAYNVFIMDQLDPNLDDATLTINEDGLYSKVTRLIEWEIGELPSGGKGSVSFSVNVKTDVSHNTEIMNFANVHFPSAAEITPTNPVVNIVKTTVADAQTVETISGVPKAIALTGRDLNNLSLTYRVTKEPIYGTLAGTPPNITYTSDIEFSGQDELLFVVNNGENDSDPARVTIKVNPNPSDRTPPVVTATYPTADATDVPAPNQPVTTNSHYGIQADDYRDIFRTD